MNLFNRKALKQHIKPPLISPDRLGLNTPELRLACAF